VVDLRSGDLVRIEPSRGDRRDPANRSEPVVNERTEPFVSPVLDLQQHARWLFDQVFYVF